MSTRTARRPAEMPEGVDTAPSGAATAASPTAAPLSALDAGEDLKVDNAGWSFGGPVAEAFDGHVAKSVPLYHEGHGLIADLSDFFVKDDSVVYEIGASTGTLTRMLAERHRGKPGARFVGLDVEPDMVAQAKRKCADLPQVEMIQADATRFAFQRCDLVICYYTMQFVSPKHRQQIFNTLYQALDWGGALLLFEKVRGPDARFQDIASQLYLEYKLQRGYRPDDVVGKMRSLKGVLEPFTSQANVDFLKRAGFQDVTTILKYVCFEGFLAIK